MGFSIAEGTRNITQAWIPIDGYTGTSMYIGQLCRRDNVVTTSNGIGPLVVSAGVTDVTTVAKTILGIVAGFNNYPLTETLDTTYGQYMSPGTSGNALSAATQKSVQKLGVGGMYPMGDPMPMAQVAFLDSTTWVKCPIYNATYGTAPTVSTVTTGSATGVGCTVTAGSDVANVSQMGTTYFRTGANAGLYRVNSDTSVTVYTFTSAFPYPIAVGDTCVNLPFVLGDSYVNINSTAGYLGMCLICNQTAATNFFRMQVKELNFQASGKEYIIGRFSPAHFAGR